LIGRITTSGAVSNYTGPDIAAPFGITTGPDGALWFTNFLHGADSIGRVTTGGAVSNYPGKGISDPREITAGPDGALWFTNFYNSSIGRITTPPYVFVSPSSGLPASTIAVNGGGLKPGKAVKVEYATGLKRPKAVVICETTATTDGSFMCTGDIPAANSAGTTGPHTITAKGKPSVSTVFTLT
jgi:hypothetical protein